MCVRIDRLTHNPLNQLRPNSDAQVSILGTSIYAVRYKESSGFVSGLQSSQDVIRRHGRHADANLGRISTRGPAHSPKKWNWFIFCATGTIAWTS